MWDRQNVVVAIVAFTFGFLGVAVGICVTFWFRLPDHTIDLLTFTESAFGIGMTVIALFFSLVLVNQVKEIDRRFDEKGKEFDQRFTHAMEVFAHNASIITKPDTKGRTTSKQQMTPHHAAASMSGVGLENITPIGDITTINESIDK